MGQQKRIDVEITAIRRISNILEKFDPVVRARVLGFVGHHYRPTTPVAECAAEVGRLDDGTQS